MTHCLTSLSFFLNVDVKYLTNHFEKRCPGSKRLCKLRTLEIFVKGGGQNTDP